MCCARTARKRRYLPNAFAGSAIHARFLQWERAGFFKSLWQAGLTEYDALRGIAWQWQSIDGTKRKAWPWHEKR